MTPRFIPDLVDIEQELFELPQKVCVNYIFRLLSLNLVLGARCIQQRSANYSSRDGLSRG
jgi:hypothetical protein